MAYSEKYEIGSEVRCTDGPCGRLTAVVVDPVAARLAHLIVLERHQHSSRLVPVSLAHAGANRVDLQCTIREFDQLEPAVVTHFLKAGETGDQYGYRHHEVMFWPFFGLGPTRPGVDVVDHPEPIESPHINVEDRVPVGEVRIRRGEHVRAGDGRIGRVRGLVVDPSDEKVTHILLDEGHLWGHKEVAIPIGAVTGMDEEDVTVRLTKEEIKHLPPIDVTELA
jgi:hypothetical protein